MNKCVWSVNGKALT